MTGSSRIEMKLLQGTIRKVRIHELTEMGSRYQKVQTAGTQENDEP